MKPKNKPPAAARHQTDSTFWPITAAWNSSGTKMGDGYAGHNEGFEVSNHS